MKKIFNEEIELIQDVRLRDFVNEALENVPEYFYRIPASPTGKYHPKYALGNEGLVRHTKAAIKIANALLDLEHNQDLEKDLAIISLLLHDTFKLGEEEGEKTSPYHANLAHDFVLHYVFSNKYRDVQTELIKIADAIDSHMGEWSTGGSRFPMTELQKFVHECDFLASRKFIEIQFD